MAESKERDELTTLTLEEEAERIANQPGDSIPIWESVPNLIPQKGRFMEERGPVSIIRFSK